MIANTVVPVIPSPSQIDPTRTISLQRRLQTAFLRRLKLLKRDIFALVVTEDAFGLKKGFGNELVPSLVEGFVNRSDRWLYGRDSPESDRDILLNTRWAFREDSEKVEEFRKWLNLQFHFRLIGTTADEIENSFWDQYIQEGFLKGAGKAFESVRRRPVLEKGLDFYEGTKAEFLRSSFGNPQTIDKVKMLSGRVFSELKGVSDTMATQMQRTLVDGFVQGKGPRVIARDLTRTIDDIGFKRATTIARTEIVRTYNEGQLNSLERLGVEEVGITPEWSTAKDGRVCPLCFPMEGVVFTIKEARGMLPRHPNCRCAFIPSSIIESSKDKVDRFAGEFGWTEADLKTKRSKTDVQRAIDRSIQAEAPTSKRTLAQQKNRSKWVGADKKISKKRPKPLIDDITESATPKRHRRKVKPTLTKKSPTAPTIIPRASRPLTKDELSAISHYAGLPGGVSTRRMQQLLKGEVVPKPGAEEIFTQSFLKAANKLPIKKTKGYRGIAVSDTAEFQVGKSVDGQIIESWTTDKTVADGYAITTRLGSEAVGGTRTKQVVFELDGEFVDPKKHILNPAGKEVWRLKSNGYIVTETVEKTVGSIGKILQVKVRPITVADDVVKFTKELEGLERKLKVAKKHGFKNSIKEFEAAIAKLKKQTTPLPTLKPKILTKVKPPTPKTKLAVPAASRGGRGQLDQALRKTKSVDLPKGKVGADQFREIKKIDPKAKMKRNDDGSVNVSYLDEYQPKKIEGSLHEFDPEALELTEFTSKNTATYKGDKNKPIAVTKKDGDYFILDGHHRAKLAKEEGRKVKGVIIPLADVEAMKKKNIHQSDMLDEWIKGRSKKTASKDVTLTSLSKNPKLNIWASTFGDKVDSETGKLVASILDTYDKQFPGIFDGLVIKAESLGPDVGGTFRREFSSRTLVISKDMLDNPKHLTRITKSAKKSKWLAGDDIKHLIDHEIGHVIDFLPDYELIPKRLAKVYIRKNPPTRLTLSGYAESSKEEAWAEAWAKLRSGKSLNKWEQGFKEAMIESYKEKNQLVPDWLS